MAEREEPSEQELAQIPIPEQFKQLTSFFAATQQPVFPPFASKVNEAHIDKILDITDRQYVREFEAENAERELENTKRKYAFARLVLIAVLGIGLFIFLTVYMVDRDRELYKEVLKIGLTFLSGLGLGGGVAYHLGRKAASKENGNGNS
jgi:hypothetical protein